MTDLTIGDVAEQLGVDPTLARRLVAAGDLPGRRLGHQWIVSSEEVARFAGRRRSPGRPMAPARAWGLLDLLDGRPAPWLAPSVRRQTLARANGLATADADRWRALLRGRSRLVRVHAHPAAITRLVGGRAGAGARVGGAAAAARLGIDLVALHERLPEVYVLADAWLGLEAELGLRIADQEPDLLVRIPLGVWPFVDGGEPGASALAADLLESAEPRAVVGGLAHLRRLAERLPSARS